MPQRRAVIVPVLLACVAAAITAIAVIGWLQTETTIEQHEREEQRTATRAVGLMIAGLENTMLQGKGVTVAELLERNKLHVPEAEVHIFDHRGYEVFAPRPPPPVPSTLAPELRRVLEGTPRVEAGGRVYRAIEHEDRCRSCHLEPSPLRGVLAYEPKAIPAKRETVVPELIRAAFVHVMTSNNAGLLDEFFAELHSHAPTLVAVGVYSAEGDLRFGLGMSEITPEDLRGSLTKDAAPRSLIRGENQVVLVALNNGERCAQCHKDDRNPVRGVLAVTLGAVDRQAVAVAELEAVMDSTIRVMMMASLGRMILQFLRGADALGAIANLVIYDGLGRTYYDAAPANPPADVRPMLTAATTEKQIVIRREPEHNSITHSLPNSERCVRCHGTDSTLRGVVTLRVPRGEAPTVRAVAERTKLMFTALGAAGLAVFALAMVILFRRTRALEPAKPEGGSSGPEPPAPTDPRLVARKNKRRTTFWPT